MLGDIRLRTARRLQGGWNNLEGRRIVGAALVAGAVVIGVLLVLGPIASLLAGDTVEQLPAVARAKALDDVRRTLITAFGGVAALVAIGFTARTYYLSKRGQVTDRFGKAVSQLASGHLEERLGGIHALEQVMAESPRDHAAVVAMVCAFVRVRTLIPPEKRRAIGENPDFGPVQEQGSLTSTLTQP